jgi:hypothetical protein
VAHARPDLSAFVTILASDMKATFVPKDHVDHMNEKILTLKATAHVGLQFENLDYGLRLVTYVDGNFANREDKYSQIGYVRCLVDKDGHMCILSYRPCKARRVCRSAMASETLAFVEGFDASFTLRSQLSDMLGKIFRYS